MTNTKKTTVEKKPKTTSVPKAVKMETEVFTSHKQVRRFSMNKGAYNAYRGWDHPKNEDASELGYLVEYMDRGKPNDPRHKGYISWSPKTQFDNGYISQKTLKNTDVDGARKNVSDLCVFGNGDTFQLICKASSKNEGWMKSTKAMEVSGIGCVVQVTTQQQNKDGSYSVAEALTFVPGVAIKDLGENGRKLIRN